MRRLALLSVLLLPPLACADDGNHFVSLREDHCFLLCGKGESGRNPVNVEYGRRFIGEKSCCSYVEWSVSQTIVPGRWTGLGVDGYEGFAYTAVGISGTVRSPGAVNLIARLGVFHAWAGETVLDFEKSGTVGVLDLGIGVNERFEFTLGVGAGGLSTQLRWNF